MQFSRHLLFSFACVAFCATPMAMGQSETATISGFIVDSSGAIVRGASVELLSVQKGTSSTALTNDAGIYVFASVQPGQYSVTVRKQGFKQVDLVGVTANVQDHIEQNFKLQVGSVSESVTVEADGININTTDGTVGTVVDRQFVENIPLNGRSFQSLILLTPGVTPVPGASNNHTGEFSVNGQRTETNYYTVDGVSANTGMANLTSVGGTPGETTLGTTQSLVSIDALEEFRINTSTYSAEYGRMPGGQISFRTRSGTNTMHGSAFEYFRNDAMDANNWFNDAAGLAKTAERQNDFGATLGGPIPIPGLDNGQVQTFFFFSYEGLRLTVPQPAFSLSVPDAAMRQNAATAIQPLLNAFPVQNGAEQGNGLALFTGSYSSPSSLDAYSIRADHSFGTKLNVFGRYADTPSNSQSRDLPDNFATVVNQTSDIKSVTIGATSQFSAHLSNELRFNFTSNNNGLRNSSDNFGGATPVTTSQLFPGISLPTYYNFGADILIGTNPLLIAGNFAYPVHQWNITDSVSSTFGAHTLKYGIDYRQQTGTQGENQLQDYFFYFGANNILSNSSPYTAVNASPTPVETFKNFSTFLQDEWRATTRFNVSLGLRWDLNPAPTGNPLPYTLNQITDLGTAVLAPKGTSLWQTDYHGFAPRVGFAYQLQQKPGQETVVRGGFGIFYSAIAEGREADTGGAGTTSSASYFGVPFPLTAAQQTLPAPTTDPPYQIVNAANPNLKLPYTMQWNLAVQRGLGVNQTATVSYVAAAGRQLLQVLTLEPTNNPNFASGSSLFLLTNASASSYNSLQVQYQRRLAAGLQALASYTYAHSIDNLSSNQNYTASLLRGNSDFDVRHNFSAGLTYDVPGGYSNAIVGAILKHWGIDLRVTSRSALPVNILGSQTALPNGQVVYENPNLVHDEPIYVADSQAPGGRVVNFNAFTAVSNAIGDAPRNFVRGFAATQADLAIRREFPLHERLKLQFRAEVFNLFNHPNFGTIYNSLSDGSTLFGRANNTLNNALGGLNPLYQMGGPRSLQLALKLSF
jgi:hypothetical protein